MDKRKVVFVYFCIGLLMISANISCFAEKQDNEEKISLHAAITIKGNQDFTKKNGVREGLGTKEDPYIISNWKSS